MSSDTEEVNEEEPCCASCGITQGDGTTLMKCTACHLVRYCSDECEELHRPEHEETCKKRAAELRDELLFKQPESTHFGDCPICCLPVSLDTKKNIAYNCCSKSICKGCAVANWMGQFEMRREIFLCPFCREPAPETEEERDKRRMKRIEANDPVAMRQEGMEQHCKGEYGGAFEYFTKASELGDLEAHFKLALAYQLGRGVEEDNGKSTYHMEEAAIGGHPHARYGLGLLEVKNGNIARAVKHWIIAATQGEHESIKTLMDTFKRGFVEKDELASALRAHKAAVDATKSPEREAAEEFYRNNPDL